jgi:uncharacterized repeat protein (TIGR03803 family)
MRSDRLLALSISVALAVIVLPSSLAWAGSNYKVLYSFTGGSDGGGVFAGVVLDQKGNIYGATTGGGAHGGGTAFELTPGPKGRWAELVLYSFCSLSHCDDGASPQNTPVMDSLGNVYGAAGATIYELTPGVGGWGFQVIYHGGSEGGLIIDRAGDLYGEWGPGKYKAGDIFELIPGSGGWTESLLYNFCGQRDCRDGEPPEWGLAWDAAGNLYGTTKFGGGNSAPECSPGCGVAYQLQAMGGGKWKFHVLHRFAAFPQDGLMPQAGVTVDGEGDVYGTTLYSGISSGTVFELSPQQNGSWKETILYNFPNAGKNGGAPVGGVTFDKLGNLYGTASAGGDPTCSCGVVFKMTPQANGRWTYTVLHRFKGTDGYGPGYNLIFDKSYKHLYGTTAAGGSGGYGVVFEITP